MEEQIFNSNYPIETEKDNGPSPVVDEVLIPVEEKIEGMTIDTTTQKKVEEIPDELKRKIPCPVCGKMLNCKNPDYDKNRLQMHVGKYHKEHKLK